jgi:hypothetical protein
MKPENIRLWSFESSFSTTTDNIVNNLTKSVMGHCLFKLTYEPWSDKVENEIEINKNVMFPGKSMEVVRDM